MNTLISRIHANVLGLTRIHGVRYTFRHLLIPTATARLRGAILAAGCSRWDPPRFADRGARIISDRDSAIDLGKKVQLHSRARIVAARSTHQGHPSKIRIGSNSLLKADSLLMAVSGTIEIGSESAIGRRSEIHCRDATIAIGNHVRIAPETMIMTGNHVFDRSDIPISDQGVTHESVVIEDDVWIGTRVIILPGVTIGNGSVVGAGAVVSHDVEPTMIVAGVPARPVRPRN
jgi:acetyltransferase-like isoleucine patch superfamily enzyme